jgi:hypothetical protein
MEGAGRLIVKSPGVVKRILQPGICIAYLLDQILPLPYPINSISAFMGCRIKRLAILSG